MTHAGQKPEFGRATEWLPAVGLTGVIIMMVVPVPAFLLDLSLVMSIALSLTILIVSLYVKEALDFSAFPTVLLFATLLRLALNVGIDRLRDHLRIFGFPTEFPRHLSLALGIKRVRLMAPCFFDHSHPSVAMAKSRR